MEREYQYLSVAGHGWSGSEALMDMLREFDTIGEFGAEFRILRDPHGIMDLEYQMVDRWDALNIDIAIKDFLIFAGKMARKRTKFKWGGDFDKIFHEKFYEYSVQFVQELTSFEYNSYWWLFDYRLPYLRWVYQRLAKRIGHKGYSEKAYFGRIERKEFHEAVQRYINSFVELFNENHQYNYFIIKQGVSATYPCKILDYCPGAKVLFVERDPRDNYVQMVEKRKLIGCEINDFHDVMKYVEWYKAQRRDLAVDTEDIMYIQYEDLIYHYDEMLEKILAFITVEGKALHHARKKQLFNPEISIKYIGAYKNYPYQDEIKVIERELSEYLYQYDGTGI